MKTGLFGGTFDPVHLGHLRCAEEILEMFGLEEIVFMPAASQPLKAGQKILPFHHRESMIKLAISDNDAFSCSDLENQRSGLSYSVDTVVFFLEHYSDGRNLYFILGEDAFQEITLWKDWRKLLSKCHFIVMTRPGYTIEGLNDILPHDFSLQYQYDQKEDGYRGPEGMLIYFRRLTHLDISSTDIRNRLAAGRSIRYLVPGNVLRYIAMNRLYR